MFGDSKNVNVLYQEYENSLWLERFKVILIIAAVAIPLFGILDFIVYRKYFNEMISVRLAVVLLAIIALSLCEKLKNYMWFLTHISTFTFYACINSLIFISKEGASSPYYAGLNLATIAVSAIIPWNAKVVIIILVEKITLYLLTIISFSIINHQSIDKLLLSNNLFFMASTGCFCIAAKHLESRMKYKEFYLKLYENNQELEKALENLSITQGQLIHSEKLNAIGSLSAGLLHEINNPLNYASMAVNMAKQDEEVKDNKNLQNYIIDIEDGINRVIAIVKDLKSFAHPTKDNKTDEFRVVDIIEKARRFTSSEMQNITFTANVEDDLKIKVSENHIIQVFVNLITNACKAINKKSNKGGDISVIAKKSDQNVIIEISDNGIGMSLDTANKIFEPFYTTREVGEGLGLGLSICYTILKNHNASIDVKSEENIGTKFTITFPK